MIKKLLFLLFFISLGCQESKKTSSKVFFSGEIVNPTSPEVVLFKGEDLVSSAQLDSQNRFTFQFDSLENGLYHFKHAPEYQYVYLKKGDSLLIRLNTIDFDESLVFSGTGSEVNNFLLELFLANEKEEDMLYRMYKLSPEDFHLKIDSLKKSKLGQLEELKKESGLTVKEGEIAQASILYHYHTFKERYPFKHKKFTGNQVMDKLPEDFYGYRKNLTFSNKEFNYLRPYYNFMTNHFGNLSYVTCSEKCGIKNDMVKNHLHFNQHKLRLIDSLVKNKDLRDNLFRNVAFDYLLQVHDSEENNRKFIEEFHELSGNNRHIAEVDELYEGILNIQPNKEVPDINVLSIEGKKVSLREIAKDSRTVFYFWSGTDETHFRNITKRAKYLATQMPEHQFVGINLNTDEAKWRLMLESKSLDKERQYRAEDFEEATKALIIYPMNKCIIVEDAKIINAFSNMYASSF